MAEFASRGVGNAGLTTGIIGSALGAINSGILPNLFGGQQACHENMPVTRYDAAQSAEIERLRTEISLRDANTYTDQKLLEVYKYFDGKVEGINQRLCEQSVWNTAQTGTISCMAQQIAALQGLTKTVIPAASICPEVMPRYNSWAAPAAPTTTTT